jgi:hypothetical protein
MDKIRTRKKDAPIAPKASATTSDTEDELTKAQSSSKTPKPSMAATTKKPSRDDPPSHDSDARAHLEILSLRKELELQRKKSEEQEGFISDLKKVIAELREMVSLLKTSNVLKAPAGGPPVTRDKKFSDEKVEGRGSSKKKVSFAEILKEEKVKPSFEIDKIKDSKWLGKDFKYLVSLKDGRDLWLALKEFNAEKLVSDFHEANSDAATPEDYKLSNGWKTIKKKEMTIQKKLSNKKSLSSQEIDFIALKLTSAPKDAKEFKRVHIQIANKQAISKCSYNQKLNIIRKVIHSYGLSASVVRISFIGSSVMEIYVEAEAERRFVSGMQSHGWEIVENFDFYEVKSFDGKVLFPTAKKRNAERRSLIQRLAYLMAGTKLLKLKECILDGLKASTQAQVLEREQEIKEAREGQRTAYVLERQ